MQKQNLCGNQQWSCTFDVCSMTCRSNACTNRCSPEEAINYALAKWIRTECWHPRSLLARANRGADISLQWRQHQALIQQCRFWVTEPLCHVMSSMLSYFKIRFVPWKTINLAQENAHPKKRTNVDVPYQLTCLWQWMQNQRVTHALVLSSSNLPCN